MGETKVCKCICCGSDVTVTKFASAAKVKCDSCKESGAERNETLFKQALADKAHKKEQKDNNGMLGDKKMSKCTKCGKDVLIGKFASHAKTLCDDCKGELPVVSSGSSTQRATVHMDRIDRESLPKLDDLYVIPITIANNKLRHVCCPACGTKDMNILQIHDSSSHRGLIIEYQCKNDECLFVMTGSEQASRRINPRPGTLFNYRAEQVIDLVSKLKDTRHQNIIQHMYSLLIDNDIPIGDINMEYVTFDQIKKCVPTGLDLDKLKQLVGKCTEINED